MLKFLKLKNIVNKGLLSFLFIFSINNLDAGTRNKFNRELCGLPIPGTEMPLTAELKKRIELLIDDTSKYHNYNDDIDAASAGMREYYDYSSEKYAIRLFELLFENDKGFDVAIKAAEYCMKTDIYRIRTRGITLFKVLFKKDKGFKEAINVAEKAMEIDSNFGRTNQESAIDLFIALVEVKHAPAYGPAIKAMQIGKESKDYSLKKKAEELYKTFCSLQ